MKDQRTDADPMSKKRFRANIFYTPPMLLVNTGQTLPEYWLLKCRDGKQNLLLTFYSVEELERFAGSITRAIKRLKNEDRIG